MRLRTVFSILSVVVVCCRVGAQTIANYEYWIDNSPQDRVKLAAASEVLELTLQTGSLSQGVHTLTFRAQDSSGQWSQPYCQYFLKMPPRNVSPLAASLTHYEYWIDHQQQQRVSLTATTDGVVTFDLQTDTLSQGVHTLTFRAQDSRGQWSQPYCQYFLKMPPRNESPMAPSLTHYEDWIDHKQQ